jgi:transcriptional regulator with XRE-family HTH domain
LTLEDIAKALNVSKSTVLRYETKEIENMGIDKLEALAKVLRVKPAYLMGWLDGPAPKDSAEAIIMVKKEAARAAIILNQLSPRDIDLATKVLERIASKAE